jgi:glycosyltransferase involved in cell wall biosynthesis
MTPDGAVWSCGSFTQSFWDRYLASFQKLLVIARVRTVQKADATAEVISDRRVSFVPLPPYSGAAGFIRQFRAIRRAAVAVLRPEDAVILRIPSAIASCLLRLVRHRGHPYAVEVVGDAQQVFSSGNFQHPLRPIFRFVLTREQKRQCANAAAAAYVTREMLQSTYPCGGYCDGISDVSLTELPGQPFTTHYSSVELTGEAFAAPRRKSSVSGVCRLVSVGSVAQLYKGHDVLIRALAECVHNGFDIELTIIGDGRYKRYLEELASRLGIAARVLFMGNVGSPHAVRAFLDQADLFVLASRTEGLPRAMIEAMARGLPCIGTRVGGIPELLDPEDLVQPGSVSELAAKITQFATSPDRMLRAALRNHSAANDYREEPLARRRQQFYSEVRRVTEEWLLSMPGAALQTIA